MPIERTGDSFQSPQPKPAGRMLLKDASQGDLRKRRQLASTINVKDRLKSTQLETTLPQVRYANNQVHMQNNTLEHSNY